jgi:hypothetical protein
MFGIQRIDNLPSELKLEIYSYLGNAHGVTENELCRQMIRKGIAYASDCLPFYDWRFPRFRNDFLTLEWLRQWNDNKYNTICGIPKKDMKYKNIRINSKIHELKHSKNTFDYIYKAYPINNLFATVKKPKNKYPTTIIII